MHRSIGYALGQQTPGSSLQSSCKRCSLTFAFASIPIRGSGSGDAEGQYTTPDGNKRGGEVANEYCDVLILSGWF
jgi:hypothetical protein